MMDYLGIKEISICGFDGFKEKYNDSYADPYLPSLNPGVKWGSLNDSIREVFRDFKDNAKNCHKIIFLTGSTFES